ncbi:MAG: hypothetical protein HYX69_12205 [Planctomycetia bacterium]|nr:hypothetical protein [Planctomycetia bacterium]
MRRIRHALWVLLLCTGSGCASIGSAPGVFYENPALAPPVDRDFFWDQLVDVVNDYFDIDREDRVRLVDNMLTLGRIDTVPQLGATLLEPWRSDSVNYYERLESTLQTIRRRALIQVVPVENGYLVDVAVYKELEDLRRPEHANAGDATFRYDDSLDRYNDQTQGPATTIDSFPTFGRAQGPIGPQPFVLGWVPLGRDTALEQRIIARLFSRFAPPGAGGPDMGGPGAFGPPGAPGMPGKPCPY